MINSLKNIKNLMNWLGTANLLKTSNDVWGK